MLQTRCFNVRRYCCFFFILVSLQGLAGQSTPLSLLIDTLNHSNSSEPGSREILIAIAVNESLHCNHYQFFRQPYLKGALESVDGEEDNSEQLRLLCPGTDSIQYVYSVVCKNIPSIGQALVVSGNHSQTVQEECVRELTATEAERHKPDFYRRYRLRANHSSTPCAELYSRMQLVASEERVSAGGAVTLHAYHPDMFINDCYLDGQLSIMLNDRILTPDDSGGDAMDPINHFESAVNIQLSCHRLNDPDIWLRDSLQMTVFNRYKEQADSSVQRDGVSVRVGFENQPSPAVNNRTSIRYIERSPGHNPVLDSQSVPDCFKPLVTLCDHPLDEHSRASKTMMLCQDPLTIPLIESGFYGKRGLVRISLFPATLLNDVIRAASSSSPSSHDGSKSAEGYLKGYVPGAPVFLSFTSEGRIDAVLFNSSHRVESNLTELVQNDTCSHDLSSISVFLCTQATGSPSMSAPPEEAGSNFSNWQQNGSFAAKLLLAGIALMLCLVPF